MAGVVAQRILENGVERAEPTLAEFRDRFEPGHFFVELPRSRLPRAAGAHGHLAEGSRTTRAAGGGVERRPLHDQGRRHRAAVLGVHRQGPHVRRRAAAAPQTRSKMYLKTPDEMAALFGGVPGALENTLRVTEMCSALSSSSASPCCRSFRCRTATTRTATFGTSRARVSKSGWRTFVRWANP